jgi:hypothetical protein
VNVREARNGLKGRDAFRAIGPVNCLAEWDFIDEWIGRSRKPIRADLNGELALFPFPHFAACDACGIGFKFEGAAKIIHARELLRSCLVENHASIAH